MLTTKQQNHPTILRANFISYDSFRSVSATAAVILILSIFLPLTSASASEAYQFHHPTARTLLQAQQSCSVNFENLNYTIITSRCKGPRYPPKMCCEAFKDFACPYADELNDPKNNCATTMFSYINLYGHYPPGLFANECRDSKRGLECTDAQSSFQSTTTSAAATTTIAHHPLHCLFLLAFLLLFHFSF